MGDQPFSFHQELILLSLAPEDCVILEDQAFHGRPGVTLEEQGCGKSADSATHDHAVIDLVGIGDVLGKGIVEAVANGVARFENLQGIAVGSSVLADPAVASEIIRLGQ